MIPVFANDRIMARRPRVFAPGLLYHVIVRGNQRRKTFLTDMDYKAYLDRLAPLSSGSDQGKLLNCQQKMA